MIKAAEMMFGSFIQTESGDIYTIETIHGPSGVYGILSFDDSNWRQHRIMGIMLNPIPLSPDWLRRAGYRDIGQSLWSNRFRYDVDFENGKACLRDKYSDDYISVGNDFQYVHELQLKTFALTGTHLTFDEKPLDSVENPSGVEG